MDLSGKVNKKNQRLPQTHIKSVFALYSNGQIKRHLIASKPSPKTILMNRYFTILAVLAIKQSANLMLQLNLLKKRSLSNQTTLR
jgi:hypothetical protein